MPIKSTLRAVVATHCAAVGLCVACSRLDGRIPLDGVIGTTLGVLLWGALLAWLFCPLTIVAVALRRGISRPVAYALVAEGVLCLFQLFALLPAVA